MTRRALLAAALLVAACHRPAPEPRAELTVAWLREPDAASGFELREDGALELLGPNERSGLAWNVAHGELVLSTNTERQPEPRTSRLAIAELANDRLVLDDAEQGEAFAGSYRRAQVAHVFGIATYRERMALAPDARLELEVASAGTTVASHRAPIRAPVPIAFDVSFVPTARAQYTLAMAIREGDRTLFSTAEPLPVSLDGEPIEVVLTRSSRTSPSER